MARYLKITWSHSSDVGDILYQTNWKNRIYLDVELSPPEYRLNIESTLDGDNTENKSFQKWEKYYRFEIYGTEDLADAFSLMQIHDAIEIVLQNGESAEVKSCEVDITWMDNNHLAKIEVIFVIGYYLLTDCPDNLETGCACATDYNVDGVIEATDPEYTDPLGNGVNIGDIYLVNFTTIVADKQFTGSIQEYTANGWSIVSTDETCIHDDDSGDDWIYYNLRYNLKVSIFTLTQNGNNIEIVGFAPTNSLVKVYIQPPGGAPEEEYTGYYGSDLRDKISIEVDEGAGSYDVKVEADNHSCDYGDSGWETIVLT